MTTLTQAQKLAFDAIQKIPGGFASLYEAGFVAKQALADGWSPGDGSSSIIVLDPSQPSDGNRVQTWAEVMTAVDASNGAMRIYPVGFCTTTIGTYDMKLASIRGFWGTELVAGGNRLTIADGAVLQNLGPIAEGGFVACNSNTQASIELAVTPDHASLVLALIQSGRLDNLGTHACISVSTDDVAVVLDINTGGAANAFVGPILEMTGASQEIYQRLAALCLSSNPVQPNWLVGPSDATLYVITDGTNGAVPADNAGFLGITIVNP